MDIESFRMYCLSKLGSEECFPFDEDTLVFKVLGKMFALCGLSQIPLRVNLKSDPDYAVELRESFPEQIIPGWHMNKKHWNTVYLEDGLENSLIKELVDNSYDLVVAKLPKKDKERLKQLTDG